MTSASASSVSIVRQLFDTGFVDELHLFVDPILVRDGMRLFDERGATLPLTFISSATFTTGVVHLVYGPVESVPDGNSRAMADAGRRA